MGLKHEANTGPLENRSGRTSESLDLCHEGESRTVKGGPRSVQKKAIQQSAATKRKVQRHSPDRLLRQKVVLPGDITVSAEKHRGRLVVRVESPDDER